MSSFKKLVLSSVGAKNGIKYNIYVNRVKGKNHIRVQKEKQFDLDRLKELKNKYIQVSSNHWMGLVLNNTRPKTIAVLVNHYVKQKFTKMPIKKRRKYHVHDEKNECVPGDVVLFKLGKKRSKSKAFDLVTVVKPAGRMENFLPMTEDDKKVHEKNGEVIQGENTYIRKEDYHDIVMGKDNE
ncbi:hypothetical protein MHBO_000579 [Bonamia ostreae]|uniref:30S ribosomal protein S17, chloroplastic n=1 Tax=Bonamia ostreae TaxID=126728 RepID=A0ABV2AGN9_9EUKA